MAIVVESYDVTKVGSDYSMTGTVPSGVQSGDVILVVFSRDSFDPEGVLDNYSWDISTSGYVEFYYDGLNVADNTLQAYYKISDGTETSFSATTTLVRSTVCWVIRLSGVDTTDLLNDIVVGTTCGETSPPLVITECTTTVNNSMAFAFFSFDGGDGDPFTASGTGWGTTPIYDEVADLGLSNGSGWITKTVSTAGGSSSVTISSTPNEPDGLLGIQFAFPPSGSSPPSGYLNQFLSTSSAAEVTGVSLSNISSISGV